MKKLFTTISIVSIFAPLAAQIYTPTGSINSTSNPSTNNVGIGTQSPAAVLDVVSSNGKAPIIRGNGGYIPSGLRFIDDSYTTAGEIKQWAIWKGNGWAKGLGFMRYDAVDPCKTGVCDTPLFLHDNGNVGVGTPSPQHKFDVSGNARFSDIISGGNNSWIFHTPDDNRKSLHIAPRNTANSSWDWGKSLVINEGNAFLNGKFEAKEIKVTLTPTADFVFEENYNLPKLQDIEKFIKEKKHLPEIASAELMEKEGVNVGEFQIKLLQKIEELTLYSIEQNKLIQEQQKRIEALEKQRFN